MIRDEDRERVRQATDIIALVSETVELRRRGADFWGCCPFHHEKSPSFHVNPATGLWKCFGCGKGGDVFAYVMEREGLDFPDSIRYLADRAGIELSEERGAGRRGPRRNRLVECVAEAESYYSLMLMRGRGEGPAAAREYLAGRGFGSAVCRRWHLGYAPGRGGLVRHLRSKGFTVQEMYAADVAHERSGRAQDRFYERVMFPIHDELGRPIAFGGRVLGDAKPKYLNTKETAIFHKGKHLFAFDRAKEGIAAEGVAVVCEGYTDVIALHEAGFTNAVAALGTSFSLDHVRTLSRFAKRIVCMFDGDAAGQRAAERAIQFLDKTDADLRCVVLPDGQDPAEFLASHQPAELREILGRARPLMDFVIERRLASYDLGSPGRRVSALRDLAQVLAPLRDSYLLDGYATQLADALGMDAEETKRAIRSAPVRGEREQDAGAMASPVGGAGTAPGREGASPGSGRQLGEGVLSADERMQLSVERELLSLIASDPDGLRPHAERIASFSWCDARHESMAWAMLATPEGTPASEVVAAATAVEPQAPRILSSGRLVSQPGMSQDEKISFLLDTVELYSTRRRIREIRSRLRSTEGQVPGEGAVALFSEATRLQRRANELARSLSAVGSA